MDRVLDLEEKEQLLTADNEQLRKDCSLLKTNEILKDAEEKYMDKIMELEEIQHRYQSQLSLLETAPFKVESPPPFKAESPPVTSADTSESLSQVHVSQVHGIQLQVSKSDMSVDTSDLHITSVDT